MSTPTDEFFERIASQKQPLLSQLTTTLRFDVDDAHETKHWYLDINKGDITVSHRKDAAAAVVHTHHDLLDRLVTGQANTLAATLRGQIMVEGDTRPVVQFQRILPGPPAQSTVGALS
jgi:putative sterol carrier protein